MLLLKYQSFFCSSSLQFSFKSGYSTTLCTGMIKNIVSRYIHNGSVVYDFFFDPSKAFDLVDHHIKLQERGLPAPILCFLYLAGINLSRCVCVGIVLCQTVSLCPMVYVREVCSLQFYLLYIWMDCYLSWRAGQWCWLLLGGSLCGCSVLCR